MSTPSPRSCTRSTPARPAGSRDRGLVLVEGGNLDVRANVTLARLDNASEARLVAFVQMHNLFRSEPVPVERFTLFSSRLGKEQPAYTAEVEYALTAT